MSKLSLLLLVNDPFVGSTVLINNFKAFTASFNLGTQKTCDGLVSPLKLVISGKPLSKLLICLILHLEACLC